MRPHHPRTDEILLLIKSQAFIPDDEVLGVRVKAIDFTISHYVDESNPFAIIHSNT